MWRLAALLVLGWLGELPEADGRPELSVDAAPSLRCPAPEGAVAALARQLAPRTVVETVAPRGRFHLVLRRHGAHGVAMTLRAGPSVLVARTIEVAAHECAGLADTVALIAAAWLRAADEPPRTPAASLPAPGAPDPNEDVPDRDAGLRASPEEGENTQPAPRAPSASPASVGGADTRAQRPSAATTAPPSHAPAVALAPPAPPSPLTPAATPAPATTLTPAAAPAIDEPPADRALAGVAAASRARSPRHRLSVEAALGTTVSLAGLAVPTLTGRVGVEARRDRWHLGLRGHAESARALDPAGVLSIRHAQLELACGPTFADGGMLHGAVLLGAGVDLLAAASARHPRRGVQRSFTPIGSLALRAGLRAHRALDVFASAELAVALRRERFTADGEALARTARARTRLLVGVSWHVF